MLGLASFLDWRGGQKTAQGIMWFGLGAIMGWPFAGALIIPLLLEEVAISFIAGTLGNLFVDIFKGIIRCLAILVRFFRLLLLRFSLSDIGRRNRG